MNMLFEQQVPILATGILAVVIALLALLRTGLMRFLYVAIGLVMMTMVMSIVERAIVTPAEEVEATIHQIARDLESNQLDAVLQHVPAASVELQSQARRALRRIEIDRVAIKRNLTVEVISDSPRSARASFNVVVIASDRRGDIRHQTSPWFFELSLEKEGDVWKIVDFERHPPQKGIGR